MEYTGLDCHTQLLQYKIDEESQNNDCDEHEAVYQILVPSMTTINNPEKTSAEPCSGQRGGAHMNTHKCIHVSGVCVRYSTILMIS